MKRQQMHELLYQSLETENGGIEVYRAAIACAINEDLREEWEKYLTETENHRRVLLDVFAAMDLDPNRETSGRQVVRHIGKSLVIAMEMAQKSGTSAEAELVAAECVVHAETKDHLNWELLGEVAKSLKGEEAKALKAACDEIEDQEDEHLYHTLGWTRELHLSGLGLPAVLPPPEEKKHVKTMIGAGRAKAARTQMKKTAAKS